MKKIRPIYLAIIAVFLISCSKDDNDDDAVLTASCVSNIPFLQPGKFFEYDTYQFGNATGTLKFTIGECNGSGFLVTRQAFNQGGSVYTSGIDLWKQDGELLLTDSNNNGDYFAKIYKKNAVLGETWQFTRPTDNAIIKHEVVDMDSIITVPAGTFHCKVFKYTNSETINDSYIFWNDEVGNIMEDADGFIRLELKSHN